MNPTPCITTSWDDGHPLDFRVAGMLQRHRLRGTFYVPREAETGTMTPAQVRALGAAFELGAHTLGHVDLTGVGEARARHEIASSRDWLEDCAGKPCEMFCPPKGRFRRRDLALARDAGFLGVRTVELASLDPPRRESGVWLMPTTVQAHPHGRLAFARNFAKRAAFRNLWLYLLHGGSDDWRGLARRLLGVSLRRGGVFHLWGHSWEVEQTGQWGRLDELLGYLGEFTDRAPALTNAEVCRAAAARAAVAPAPAPVPA